MPEVYYLPTCLYPQVVLLAVKFPMLVAKQLGTEYHEHLSFHTRYSKTLWGKWLLGIDCNKFRKIS